LTGHFYIIGTIFFTVYGQLVIKWRMSSVNDLPDGVWSKIPHLIQLLMTDLFLISGFAAAFLAALCWMVAMTRFDVSYAYPFMSAAFILVLVFSALIFREPVTFYKVAGMVFIVLGIFLTSRSIG